MRILLLAYYHRRYMAPLAIGAGTLRKRGHLVREMYPDLYYNEDVLEELRRAPYDCILYFGHGMPGAWAGFSTISAEALCATPPARQVGLVISLACHGFTPDKKGHSLCRSLVESCFSEHVAGFKGEVLFEHNLTRAEAVLRLLAESNRPDELTADLKELGLEVANQVGESYTNPDITHGEA